MRAGLGYPSMSFKARLKRRLRLMYGNGDPKIASPTAVFDDIASSILKAADLRPVLADVGAAGNSPAIWQAIAPNSLLIGFEPDGRDPDATFGQGFADSVLIPKAVCAAPEADSVEFILTRYPSCSSMLPPDLDALESFAFRDLFEPISRQRAPATTLDKVIAETDAPGLHWIKIDSQGADLRILDSLSPANRDALLAVDIEPGLIHAYQGEDLFVHCHAWLLSQGFWLSRLDHQAYPKIRPATLAALARRKGMDPLIYMRGLPKTPTAIEGRYFRELRWLERPSIRKEDLLMSAAFALLDGQTPYAFDVSELYIERFGGDKKITILRDQIIEGLDSK